MRLSYFLTDREGIIFHLIKSGTCLASWFCSGSVCFLNIAR
jgi:hypothetical protein